MGEMSFNAKTLEEAITKACVELGVTSDKITYNVVDQGSRGFLGIGARNCVINVIVNDDDKKEAANEAVEEKKQPVIKKAEEVKSPEASAEVSTEKEAPASKETTAESRENKRSEAAEKTQSGEAERPYKKDRKNERGFDKRNDRGERRNSARSDEKRNAGRSGSSQSGIKEEAPAVEKEIKPIVLTEDPVERAKSFLESLFGAMEMNIDYSGKYDNTKNELTVNLSGEDMGVLIGKRGQTLDSLQYLTSQVVNKHQNGYIRVKLDTENYRERRKDTLETFAVNMAHKVRRNKRPVVLEPMNAYERRIIHSALQDEKDVLTRSEGEEPYRHVVICPVKKKNGGRKDA